MKEKDDKSDENQNMNDSPESDIENTTEGDTKGKRLILILIPVVIIILGVVLYFFIFSKEVTEKEPEKKQPTSSDIKTEVATFSSDQSKVFVDFDEVVSKLMTTGDKVTYIKLSFTLQLSSSDDLERVSENKPYILDSIQGLMNQVRPADLSGSAGIVLLRNELIKRINKIINPSEVKDLLFKEIYMS